MILCPTCGADRLIPLTFPVYRREAGPEVRYRRPIAKCSRCGERIFARVTARQRQTSDRTLWNEG
jgi:ribosomal protein S27AE